jgi:hypothetical protein
MTVARMEAEMPNEEWVRWLVFYGRRKQREELAQSRKGK